MLKLNLKNMFSERLSEGISESEFNFALSEHAEIQKTFLNDKKNLGFTKLPYDFKKLNDYFDLADEMMKDKDTLIVVGIGGSDLGARAIFRALMHQHHNELTYYEDEDNEKIARRIYFTGDTTDPKSLKDLSDILDLSTTLFLVVSKSGNTVEVASAFLYFREQVLEELGDDADTNHFLFITDPNSGALKELSDKHGYQMIPHPEDVGGRFSVLSVVGMIPAYLMGLNVEEFLKGAADFDKELENVNNTAFQYAVLHYLYLIKDKNITVLMPYAYLLSEFSKWFRQLWAESLGKKNDLEGKIINVGSTPVAALGPTDQHSQLQLYNDGPNDKVFTFITQNTSGADIKLPHDLKGVDPFKFLQAKSLAEILALEQSTTAFSLTKNGRPNCTIEIEQIDEYHLGQLFYFFEAVIAYMGYLLNINPYDQPGVELSKNAMYGVLGKEGFEDERKDFEAYLNS